MHELILLTQQNQQHKCSTEPAHLLPLVHGMSSYGKPQEAKHFRMFQLQKSIPRKYPEMREFNKGLVKGNLWAG